MAEKADPRAPTVEEMEQLAEFLTEQYTREDASLSTKVQQYQTVETAWMEKQIAIFENYGSWHPGYCGKVAVILYSEPCFVDIVTFGGEDGKPDYRYGGDLS